MDEGTFSIRYVRKMGRLLWQQAAPFNSSTVLLYTAAGWRNEDIAIVVFILALIVAVASVSRQDRRGWSAHDHAQD